MNPLFYELLERKLFLAEKRLRIEQKNIWLYKTMLEQLGHRPKSVQQLEMFTGS